MKNKSLSENLQYWYQIKPFATSIFSSYGQELHWIKNAWLLLCSNDETGIVKALNSCGEDEITDDLKYLLMALYDVYANFRNALDDFERECDYESWAYQLDLDISDYSEDHLSDILQVKKNLFVKTLVKAFKDYYQILLFMTNDSTALSEDEFKEIFCELNEHRVDSFDDYDDLESKYEDYKVDVVINLDFEKQDVAYGWISENLKVRREES